MFSSDFLLNTGEVQRAMRDRGMFNLITIEAVVKIDFIVRTQTPYPREEFRRRQRILADTQAVWRAAVEDLILSKLDWSRQSRSELQRRAPRARRKIFEHTYRGDFTAEQWQRWQERWRQREG